MILYFTGTGNSEYTARRIAKEPGGKICNLFTKMLVNGKPHWGNKCTHCMTCICRCSQKVIEYGKHSQELNRYTKKNRPSPFEKRSGGFRAAEHVGLFDQERPA